MFCIECQKAVKLFWTSIKKSLVYYKVRKNRKPPNRNLSGLRTYIILSVLLIVHSFTSRFADN